MSVISLLFGRKKKPVLQPSPTTPPPPQPTPSPLQPPPPLWSLGPVINGQNYSVGTVWDSATGSFTWPKAEKLKSRWETPGPHYLTRPTVGLVGRAIRARFIIDGDGLFFGSVGAQSDFAYVCLFFRAPGDNWEGIDGYRWWSELQTPLTVGANVISVPLDPALWVSVESKGTPEQFARALANAVEVGMTFGNDEGRGHGVSSPTGGSSFTLISFEVL